MHRSPQPLSAYAAADVRPARAYPPIEDYAIVGDCRSAALISRNGSLDWLCLPNFDSPSVFAAILDVERGGAFSIRPSGAYEVARRYVGRSAVLETTFRTPAGVLRLTDAMPAESEDDRNRHLTPDHEVLRLVECVEGEVPIEVAFNPRPGYGRTSPDIREQPPFGLLCELGVRALALNSTMPLTIASDRTNASGRAVLRRGERHRFSLTFADKLPLVLPPIDLDADDRMGRTVAWWEEWASQCRYEGPHLEAVVRSAITLKLMTFAPTGAIVAAPTTSLPEAIGGVRNWDYRYCWLRDASLTLRALLGLGFVIEAESFLSWLLHATRLTSPELQIMYTLFGESEIPEAALEHLEGYRASSPVRVGNAAADQLQLDVYGEVIDAVARFVEHGGRLDRTTQRLLRGLGDTVCRRWREPDDGIWEARRERRHHTHSKVMCWVALDRLIRLHAGGHLRIDAARLSAERDAIRAAVELRGWSDAVQAYVSVFDGPALDASLLRLPLVDYIHGDHPRMVATARRIRERLGVNGFLCRYLDADGLPGGEGAFALCSFWEIEGFARRGDLDLAEEALERMDVVANDLGLYAEQVDPHTGEALGNFPQAFTHIGLINAASTIAGLRRGQPPRQPARADTQV